MAFSAADLQSVEDAIRAFSLHPHDGAMIVSVTTGESVTTYSRARLPELTALRDTIRAEIGSTAEAGHRRSRIFYTRFSKGL